MSRNAQLACHLCGQVHRPVALSPGETASCTRCAAVLDRKRRLGSDAALAFAVTGLILAIPACFLPFISAGKLGADRVSVLYTGVGALWDQGMRAVAMLVLLCGAVLPVALLAILAIILAPPGISQRIGNRTLLSRTARILQNWAIPEVQVLAVLVALLKLGSLVTVSIGPGFWCYCAMAFSLLLALRNFDLDALLEEQKAGDTERAP
jgi:paraquat-inducible protein A